MQAEEAVEVECRFFRNVDCRSRAVVRSLAVRHDDVETVRRAALEEDDQALRPRARIGGAIGGSRQKTRQWRCADRGQGAVAEEHSAGNGHFKVRLRASGYELRANRNHLARSSKPAATSSETPAIPKSIQ